MNEFTIYSRVQLEGGNVVAVAIALPMRSDVLAEVRTHQCASRDEAIALLDSMSQGLKHEVLARGDSICGE